MSNQNLEPPIFWEKLVDSYKEYYHLMVAFQSKGTDRVGILKHGLCGSDTNYAISYLKYLNPEELQNIFPELVRLASYEHGAIGFIRGLILSLPKDWVLANIEAQAEPFLCDGTYDEYRRILELYKELDEDLTIRLAKRAFANSDEDIKEAGEDFLRARNLLE